MKPCPNHLSPAWLGRLPKIELHLHLEGAIRPPLLRRLAKKNGIQLPPPRLDGDEPAYDYHNFHEFLQCFKTACSVLKTPEDIASVAEALFDELITQNTRYAEIFITPVIHEKQGISTLETMQLIDGIAREKRRRHGFHCRFLFDAVRQWGAESCEHSARLAQRCRPWGVTGIGIGGDEGAVPALAFKQTYEWARAAGLHLTVHAGEACGPQSIDDALRFLQPERIGHGTRAIEDPTLLKRIGDLGITLDVSLTSNIRTGVWPQLQDHPARQFHRAGVSLTLNTDDPALFSTTLTREYVLALQLLELDRGGLIRLLSDTLRASFLEPEDRMELERSIQEAFRGEENYSSSEK